MKRGFNRTSGFKRAFTRALWIAMVNNVFPYVFVESREALRKAWLMWELGRCYMEVSGEKPAAWVSVCVTVENVMLSISVDLVKEKIKVAATNGYVVMKTQSFDVLGEDLDKLIYACRWL